ncbi:MAG: SUMF1/EgtB/PvdO family nonheme iron enzyme [Marinobacterium sp.]|nr:SUMF1/EgtB/PvdO family nonheme iron enzyme [Marinobacterium sp.]
MAKVIALLISVLIAMPAWSARQALLIGMGDYDKNGPYPPLSQPQHDIERMAQILGNKAYGFQLTTIMDEKRYELMRQTDQFIEGLTSGDSVFIYISGHGVQHNNTNYLIPVGKPYKDPAELIDRDRGALSINILTNRVIDKIGVQGVQVVVLDACRNSLFKGSGGAGLQPIATRGTLFHYSASPGEYSRASSPSKLSFYTHFLVQQLETSASLRIRDVFENTANALLHYSETRLESIDQTPWLSGNMRGRFCLQQPCVGADALALATTDTTPAPATPSFPYAPRMVKIKGGCFTMGQTDEEKQWLIKRRGQEKYDDYYSDESPVQACVNDFQMAETEVTVADFTRFVNQTGYRTDAETAKDKGCRSYKNRKWQTDANANWRHPNPQQPNQMEHPVACVSFNDVMAYIGWLNTRTGKQYRLPTEAEFEYAARGGTTTAYFWGATIDKQACQYANVADKSTDWSRTFPCDDRAEYAAPVGSYQPNPFGLKDILGNVWEWTCSEYEKAYQGKALRCAEGSKGLRVLRGGGWGDYPGSLRAALRGRSLPESRNYFVGFRVVRSAP